MTTTETPTAYGELTNTCTCTVYDSVADEWVESPTCDGDCFNSELEFLGECLRDFLFLSDTFQVSGIRLWNREVGGVFQPRNVREFVEAITVDSLWTLRYQVFSDRVEFSLSHHDAPTGSSSVVIPLVECGESECDNYTRLEVEFPPHKYLCQECVDAQVEAYHNHIEGRHYRG